MMFAAKFGRHQKRRWDAWAPFPRSVWIHPNTPKDDLDRICFQIWTRIQSPGQDLRSVSPDNINKPSEIIVNSQTTPLNDVSYACNSSTAAPTDGTKITIPGRHKGELHSEQNKINQIVQQEFKGLPKGQNIWPRGSQVHRDFSCHSEDPHDSKQDGSSTEERQQRSPGKLLKRVQGPKGKGVPWLPVIDEYPPLPCPAQPWNGRVYQRSPAAWPSPPGSSNTGGAQNVKEIQDFLRNVLLKPGQDETPPNQQGFLQGQSVPKGTMRTETSPLHVVFNEKSDIPEAETRRCQTHTAVSNHNLNADGLCVDFQSFGTAEDREIRPAGPCDKVKLHPCLERTTRPETKMTGAASCDTYPKQNAGAFKSIPPQGATELGSHHRSAGNTVLPGPHALGAPTADHCQTHPVRPPPGFQPLQQLFPQLFPPQQMTLQPGLNPLQMPTVPSVNQMNVVQEGIPPPIILFLPPGQPAPPFLMPANLPGGGPLWPSTPLRRDNFQANLSPNSAVPGFSETPLIYMKSQRWMQPS
ncbi:uncharacterized protein LOC135261384 isoform X3 [Anguilla rostrata]|uniref:uncharacterized protein LOC135261384 isoform X3 n=1 Tax=Anguilla rostrata TaxID=7938 RepID=UPI0030CAE33B